MTSTTTKRCCSCHTYLPLEDFSNRTSSLDGKQAMCRECFRDYHQSQRAYMVRRDRRAERGADGVYVCRDKSGVEREVPRNRSRWTPREDLIVMHDSLNAHEAAARVGRTVHAVYKRRSTLRQEGVRPIVAPSNIRLT